DDRQHSRAALPGTEGGRAGLEVIVSAQFGVTYEPVAAVVEVRDLRKRYRASDPWAVDGVTFTLEPGRAFGLLGPNGAGKSTVVKTIVGLARPDSGSVTVFGSSPSVVA